MARFYADIHRMANRSRKKKTEENYHIYTVDGVEFSKAEKIADIPAKVGDELYVDVIPIELADEFIELLRRGVRVFYLRRLTMLKKIYERLQMKSKTSRNDLRALMAIESRWFKEVSEDFLVMRRLISAYRALLKTSQRLKNMSKALNQSDRDYLRNTIGQADVDADRLAERISEEARIRYPQYDRIAESLGISGENHVRAREALAELMTYVDFNKGVRDIKNFLGLFKGRPKIYSGIARRALERLTIVLIGDTRISAKQMLLTVQRIRRIYREETAGERLESIPA
ncbi:hypothetical protein HRbin01_00607 [archaeon HR01]|nr:hypothetical protein HRbin01_00607 [archaeon HR01]